MPDPISTLITLLDQLEALNATQTLINNTRAAWPTDGLVQLELDRSQSEVNRKRALIAVIMADIRSRN